MDNLRLILFFALFFVLFLIWEAWQQDYGPKPQVAATQPSVSVPDAGVPAAMQPTELPSVAPIESPTPDIAVTPEPPPVQPTRPLASSQRVRVVTDKLDVIIDTRGGDIREADLVAYPVSVKEPDQPFRLMKDELPNLFIGQSGLLPSGTAPDHTALYTAAKTDYSLTPGSDELRVPLIWQSEGMTVTKTFIFKRDSHIIDVEHTVVNSGAEPWQGRQYRQLQRSRPDGSGESFFIYTYTGGAIYSDEEKFDKIKFDDMAKSDLSKEIEGGWAAMIQHYFLAAIIPSQEESNHFYTKATQDERYILGLYSPPRTVQPGESTTFTSRFYVGPKVQATLEKLAPDLDLTVDYGILTIISKPLFWLMELIYSVIHNWGWSIILVTLLIKLAFYPLSAASFRSMANMRKLQPKLMAIRERYGDDRKRFSEAMMELYKTEKINPLGGCLPMLVQIPVFIALYWVLLESVELRQAPFILWIEDLSIRDPYYILPLLMGASMIVQQKLNPPPTDPVQEKVLMAMPIIFTAFFAFFPAGLVLYWLANSVLSVAQQWYVIRSVEKKAAPAK